MIRERERTVDGKFLPIPGKVPRPRREKLTTYVIIVSRNFQRGHNKEGQPTGFVEKVEAGTKIHTLRGNYWLWEKRIKKVQEGKAIISVRYWTGAAYKTPQVEVRKFTKDDGVGIERLIMKPGLLNKFVVNDRPLDIEKELANNDGLSVMEFRSWFKKYDRSLPIAIIHFTKFRYAGS